MPIEKSLQRSRPLPAATRRHARRGGGTARTARPRRRGGPAACADTRRPAIVAKYGCASARQRVGEQPVDPRAAELAGRQADAVHDDQLRRRCRPAGRRSWARPPGARRVEQPGAGSRSKPASVVAQAVARAHAPDHAAAAARAPRRLIDTAAVDQRRPASTADPLADRDLRVVWHPCTQMKDHEWLPLMPIARGEGVWLYGYDGRRYLDAISSWWVNLFGHANPRINAAITAQLGRARARDPGRLHPRAGRRAGRAADRLAPAGATRCFYADNGSSAIEVALKMSFHYWRNRGPAAQAPLRHAGEQLPRRDARRARGRRRRAVQRDLPAAADGRDHGALARLLRSARPARLGGRTAARSSRRWRQSLAAACGRDLRGHRRAAGAVRRRHAHAPPGCTCSCCAKPATATACT